MKTRRWIVAGVLFAVLWVLVRGPVLEPIAVLGSVLVGTAVGLPVAFVFRRLYDEDFEIARLTAIPYIALYVLTFTREVLVANLDVAYRVLSPGMPLEPQVILIPLRVETALGITTIANSITITPGTMTLDYEPDENALYVHIIDGSDPEHVVGPIREWEDYALEIFDEEQRPSDPAPEIRVHPPDYPPEPKTVRPGDVGDLRGDDGEAATDGREGSDGR